MAFTLGLDNKLMALLERFLCGSSPTDPDTERKLDQVLTALTKIGADIMTAISDFATKQMAHNDRMGMAIDGIVADIVALNAKIAELQNSAGTVTPEDQALLDQLESQGDTLATKAEALDAMAPPPTPVA